MGGQAFDGPRINGFWIDCDEARIVGIDTEDGPEHVLWDVSDRNREGDPVFAAQLLVEGIRENCILRKDGDRYDVAVGRRRFQAARMIKHEPERVAAVLKEMGLSNPVAPIKIPVVIEKGDDAYFAVLVDAENVQRKDLSLMQKTQRAMRLLDRIKDKRRVALTYGVDVQTISEWSKIQDLHPSVVEGIELRRISQTAAVKLAALPRAEQITAFEGLTANGAKPTVAKTRAAAKRAEFEGLNRGQIRKVAESEDVEKAVRDFARVCLGELAANRVKGVSKAIES